MKTKFPLLFFVVISILIGCSKQPTQPTEPVTLKILGNSEMIFNNTYGNVFLSTHPNYDIEFVSIGDNLTSGETPDKTTERLIQSENPDLVVLSMNLYSSMVEQGEIVSLTDRIKKEEYDVTGYSPGIMDFLTDDSGEIHGLTPTFVGSALYYNKSMFVENGIPFPVDGMTWDELFLLAQRFPKFLDGEPQFGYYSYDSINPFVMSLHIGESMGLSIYNGSEFTLNTESWYKVFRNVTDCLKAQVCFDKNKMDDASTTDRGTVEKRSFPFLQGNIAMAIDSSDLFGLLNMNRERYSDLDWGVVSLPRSAELPSLGYGINMYEIFTIPTNSGHPDGAWEFIKYVNGNDYARMIPRLNPEALPARPNSVKQEDQIASFYAFDQIENSMFSGLRDLPVSVIMKMDEFPHTHVADILSDDLTVEEALKQMEFELDTMLDASQHEK